MTFVNLARIAAVSSIFLVTAQSASAAALMPDFANVPTGWTTDRYDPTTFAAVGSYQGRSDVLGIGITSAGNLANRAAAFQSSFYNTQGRQHAVSGGTNSTLDAGLFIENSWRTATPGNVRSDMWGVLSNSAPTPAVTDYGIIGFTNYGGAARLRVFDGDVGGWVDLATAVTYGQWMDFSIAFTGTSMDYLINGTSVYSDTTIGGNQFTAVIMQAYNFADPAIQGAVPADYTANWSNVPSGSTVPEPGSLALAALALAGLAAAGKRRKA